VREVDMHAFQAEINEYRTTLPAKPSDNCKWHRLWVWLIRLKLLLTHRPQFSPPTISTTHSTIVSMPGLLIW
jgi:hypothetical protein